MNTIVTIGVAKLLDAAIAAWLVGVAREPLVAKVREMEAAGASMDEMTDALQAMAAQSEADAQAEIDKA